jgi:hypothetical protein
MKYTPGVNDELQCQECLTGLCVPEDGNDGNPHLVRCSECGTGMGIFYVRGTPIKNKQGFWQWIKSKLAPVGF